MATIIPGTAQPLQIGDIPFNVRVTLGLIEGVSAVHKFGVNLDVDAAEDVWLAGGTWTAPTQARTMSLVSDSVADDGSPAGTGALTVTVEGLDSNYDAVSETVTLNGIGAVATTQTFTRMNRAYVATSGSGGTNAGNITITATTDATTQGVITAGYGSTARAIYTVPNGYKGVIERWSASNGPGSAASSCQFALLTRDFGSSTWRRRDMIVHHETGSTSSERNLGPSGILLAEKTDIKIIATPITGNSIYCQADFELALYANE